jgi:hypothetical protein
MGLKWLGKPVARIQCKWGLCPLGALGGALSQARGRQEIFQGVNHCCVF